MSEKTTSPFCHYADSNAVTPVQHIDYNDFVREPDSLPHMEGFSADYRDIVDYILRITHEIWEERGVGRIYDTYHNDTIVHSCSRTSAGIHPVVSGTLSHLHAFPDKKVVAEAVIWSEDSPGYYFSSHRSVGIATNLGDSEFGPKTGKKVRFRAIADCAVHNNRIYEEWLVRDNLALVHQLGLDARELALAMNRAEAASAPEEGALRSSYGRSESMEGQFYPERYEPKDDSAGEMLTGMYQNIYTCKMLNEVTKYYHPNASVNYIDGKTLCGHEEIQGMLISFLASFPNAFHGIDRITVNTMQDGTTEAAVRWRLRGLHEGIGMFGAPSGRSVEIMGISHYRICQDRIIEAWILYDGLDVLRQIVGTAGDGSPGFT